MQSLALTFCSNFSLYAHGTSYPSSQRISPPKLEVSPSCTSSALLRWIYCASSPPERYLCTPLPRADPSTRFAWVLVRTPLVRRSASRAGALIPLLLVP
uniref:Uncharacterized protein n=1 Tax=Panstrongylus lignarius TaxID=156445 RepID=A0A224Y331_9HEMI